MEQGTLLACLRGRETMASLRKNDLLALARGWRYKSTLWRRRRTCSRSVQRALAAKRGGDTPMEAEAPAAAPQVPLEPFDSRGASSAAVEQYITLRLQPLAAAAAVSFKGDEAHRAALAHGSAHITAPAADAVRGVWLFISEHQSRWHRMLEGIMECQARLEPSGEGASPQPAFMQLIGQSDSLTNLDALVQQMGLTLHRAVAADAARRAEPMLPPAEATWLEELHRGRMSALEMTSRCQALLISAKFGSVQHYLDVATYVVRLLIAYFQRVATSFESREAWMRHLLAAQPSPGSAPETGAPERPHLYVAVSLMDDQWRRTFGSALPSKDPARVGL